MTDTIHPAAARGFEAGADAYERARPDYPPDAVDDDRRLDSTCGRVGRVLELGAGNGQADAAARADGCARSSPSSRWRRCARRSRGSRRPPRRRDRRGDGRGDPAAGGSVDAVVVAQAFHWFDAIRALSEIHRVLRPGGRLAARVEPARRVGPLGARHGRSDPLARRRRSRRSGTSDWRAALARCALFEPWEQVAYGHTQTLTRAGVARPRRVGELRGRRRAGLRRRRCSPTSTPCSATTRPRPAATPSSCRTTPR